jgi:GNAT superfamily N-acetyltransferase
MGISVRVAAAGDVGTLFDIRTSVRQNHQSVEDLARLGVTPASVTQMLATDCRAWLCEVDGTPAGFSMANAAERSVFALFVRPEAEGGGIGQALLDAAENWLFSKGIPEIWLATGRDPKLRAHAFYLAHGWRRSAALPDGQILYTKRKPG